MEERKRWEEKRITDLRASGELLRRAGEIRALIDQAGDAVAKGSIEISRAQLERWRKWAAGQADRLDPVLSGQVLTHLSVPALHGPHPGIDVD